MSPRLQRLHTDLERAEDAGRRQREAAEAGRRAAFEAGERERQAGCRLQEERDRCKQAKEEVRVEPMKQVETRESWVVATE